MKPFFTSSLSGPEKAFIKYLDKSEDVDWWYKNGDHGSAHFAVPYSDGKEKKPFYVDFIVKLKNNKLGFMDTKSGNTITEAKISGKIDGLNKYTQSKRIYFGGIVTNTNPKDFSGSWRLFDKDSKDLTEEDFSNWNALPF